MPKRVRVEKQRRTRRRTEEITSHPSHQGGDSLLAALEEERQAIEAELEESEIARD